MRERSESHVLSTYPAEITHHPSWDLLHALYNFTDVMNHPGRPNLHALSKLPAFFPTEMHINLIERAQLQKRKVGSIARNIEID